MRLRFVTAAGSVALACSLVLVAGAQSQPGVSAAATLTPGIGTVGDHITLTIAVDHPDGVDVAGAPTFGANFGGLEVLEVAPPSTIQLQAGQQRTAYVYTLTSFATGLFTVPPFTLTYDGGSIVTESRSVSFETVLQPGDDTLRPLKPQLEIPEAAPSPAVPATFVAAIALLTLAGYALYARAVALRPPALAAAAAVDASASASPAARARTTLDALAASGIDMRDPAEFYARIAGTVRRYLSERYAFAAFAMTHTEMERGMAAAGIEKFPTRVAANLLEQCEAVEFARFRPAPERRAADLTAAYEVIELTSEQQSP